MPITPRKRMRISDNVFIEASKLRMIREGKKGVSLPEDAVDRVHKITEQIVQRDPKSMPFLVGGAARMYKGEQTAFRDIDIAVVASNSKAYQQFSDLKFKQEMQKLVGEKVNVDILVYFGKHFRDPRQILHELELEKKQGTYTITMLANGVPLYNPIQAKKFQKTLKDYANAAYDRSDLATISQWHVERSMKAVEEEAAKGRRFFGFLRRKK